MVIRSTWSQAVIVLGAWCLAIGLLAGCEAGTIGAAMVGEIAAEPAQATADGRMGVQITVRILRSGDRAPVQGLPVVLHALRNSAGPEVDLLEQPGLPTDADGRAVGFVGSTEPGLAEFRATVNGQLLCAQGSGPDCEPAEADVQFLPSCPSGQTACGDHCYDLESDPTHCGLCERACAFDNASAECEAGECKLGPCDENWGDCNGWEGDGCESELTVDPAHCGSCEHICPAGEECAGGFCSGECPDADGDSYPAASCGGEDCDDADAGVHPGADEVCDNGLDDDCDGATDAQQFECRPCADDADCQNGNACDGAESCAGGRCWEGSVLDCDDHNPCTDDSCAPASGCQHQPNIAFCDDGDACTVSDTCSAGTCLGVPLDEDGDGFGPLACGGGDCDDGDETVNPAAGEYGPVACADQVDNDCDGQTDGDDLNCQGCTEDIHCDDGDLCNGAEICLDGSCRDGQLLDCDDANPCTDDSCDPTAGCLYADNQGPCEDGDLCTQSDACVGGTCVSGDAVMCFASDVCHLAGTCDPATGLCSDPPASDGTPCNDGDACTRVDGCLGGVCTGTDPVVCTALDDCHQAGTCEPGSGTCSNPEQPDDHPCDDGDACTQTDGCQGGVCAGSNPVSCLPLDDCHLAGLCDSATGQCSNPAVGDDTPCQDGDACTAGESCMNGSCQGGAAIVCNDGNACTDDACDPASGCVYTNNSAPCNDGNACTVGDACGGGACQPGAAATCDDGNACTDDSCNPATGCVNTNNTASCSDGNACTAGDVCSGGSCQSGTAVNCNDGNACTDDSCNPATGCVNTNNTASCSDGNACTAGDACSGGSCQSGTAVNCNDGNACTDDSCNPATGCVNTNNTASCSDGNACTAGDVCSGGSCQSGTAVNCNDGNVCTDDSCNPATGCVNANNTASCTDGSACTTGDTCSGGLCVGGAPPNCNDGNACTDDSCNPATGCVNTNNTASCTDGNACTAGDVCSGGICQSGAAVDCNDGNVCTNDSCSPAVGCVYTYNNASCSDGNACTTGDTCSGGTCVGGAALNCDDTNVCTTDTCNTSTGCVHANNTGSCTDGNACTTNDTCSGGACVGGAPPNCNDTNVCTDDSCNPATGCVHANNTAGCSDGDACTMGDHCSGGSCVGDPLDSDGDGFVSDACGGTDCADGDFDINPGVFEGPAGDALCNDGIDNDCDLLVDLQEDTCGDCFDDTDCLDADVCNGAETCVAGSCVPGTALNCSDGNVCTNDSCNPATGCVHTNNTASCTDGNACTTGDTCSGGVCVGGAPPSCNDGNVCTDDSCNPATGCVNANNTASCTDGNACTTNDTCSGGSCVGGAALNCDDANVCTTDTCNTSTGCVHTNNTASCSDGNACTTNDTCSGGACVGGAAPNCNDGNVCTDDSCNPATGCVNANNTASCSDGNACTTNDTCSGGACVGGAPPNCDDTNVCTNDSCNSSTGCVHTNNTASCTDGNACTTNDTCSGGVCVGGAPPTCNDGNGCTDDSCNPATGCVYTNNTASCSDGNACTTGDTCSGGSCVGGPPPTCNDGNVCTTDSCNPATGCVFTNNTAGCSDGNACTTGDTCSGGVCVGGPPPTCNDGNVCTDDSCNPATGCVYTNNTSSCSDGNSCTTGDTCSGGSCVGGPPLSCDDGNVCTTDSCNTSTGCVYANNTASCTDGNACTTDDTCSGGACVGGAAPNCNDGNACTDDSCNPATGCVHANNSAVCDDGEPCTHTDHCSGGACSGTAYSCDDGNPCTLDTCLGDATCDYAANPDPSGDPLYSPVETGTADSVDNDCDGCTDEGSAGYSAPLVAVEVKPHDGGNGLRRLYGNGQFGPVGKVLPVPLTVQFNNSGGVPQVGQLVSYTVQAAGTVCYGQGGTFSPTNGLSPVTVLRVCNDAADAQVLSPAQVYTDEHGQASVLLQLGAHQGLVVVRATAGGNSVDFFAAPVTTLNTSIVVPTATTTSNTNPALGPLGVTARPTSQGSAAYLGNLNNYTLAITGLSATTGASPDGVAQAPLVAGGSLTISGANFATSGNQVWLGGVPATVTGQGAGAITVTIPEGIPGAAAVVVNDGTTTGFAGGSGNIQSVATAVANFWRLAAKPVFVFAATGTRPATTAQVRLVGLDECGNPLSLSGRTLALQAVNPDGTTSGVSVGVGTPNGTTGLATVTPVGTTRRAAVVRGTIDGVSSDALVDGNTTVTTVPNLLGPGNFVHDPALANNNGINSMILRGGDENSNTDASQLNPAFRFTNTQTSTYTVPDGSGTVYGTERQLAAATMTGQGNMTNITGGGDSAMAGTGLFAISGGSSGVQALVSARVSYDPDLSDPDVTDVNATAMSGWLRQDTSEQEFEFNSSGLMYFMNDGNGNAEHRNIVMRILMQRALP